MYGNVICSQLGSVDKHTNNVPNDALRVFRWLIRLTFSEERNGARNPTTETLSENSS